MKKIIVLFLVVISCVQLDAQCYPDQHSTSWMDSWISCSEAPSPNIANGNGHWILYDLKERYTIDQVKVWNVNDPAHLDWGIKDCKIEYSGNLTNWYQAGELRLDKATGRSNYEGMDWTNLRMQEARYVLITALSNYGTGNCYGLAEIRFSAEKVLISDINSDSNATSELSATIQPNPVSDQFMAKIQSKVGEELEYSCVDMFGHVIDKGRINLSKSNYILRVITTHWVPGQYQFVIKSDDQVRRYSVVKI